MCSSGNFACDFHDSLFLGMLDHRGNTQIGPRLQRTSSSTSLFFDFFPKGTDNPFWIRGKAIRTDQQTLHELATGTSMLQETINERVISVLAHCSCQPEACRHIHRQSHPNNDLPPFCSYLIGLNMLALDLARFHKSDVNTLTLLSCSFLPRCYGPFIEPKGMHNRLKWTTIGK